VRDALRGGLSGGRRTVGLTRKLNAHVGLASARRTEAIREGDIPTALAAAIVEQVVVDVALMKAAEPTGSYRQ
jgi:uncharacterized protein (DUF169 family)